MGDAECLTDGGGIGDIAVAVRGKGGEPSAKQAHGNADDAVALLFEQQSRHGTVHAAAHADHCSLFHVCDPLLF